MNAVPTSKRVTDIIVGTVILALAFPIIILISVILKMTSPGPIFYRQRRKGPICPKTGRRIEFNVYKFRTMNVVANLKTESKSTQKRDSRIAPIGRFLRRTQLDRLPRLVSVIKGDISFAGLRHERPRGLPASLGDQVSLSED